jgi:hypothetical protein
VQFAEPGTQTQSKHLQKSRTPGGFDVTPGIGLGVHAIEDGVVDRVAMDPLPVIIPDGEQR